MALNIPTSPGLGKGKALKGLGKGGTSGPTKSRSSKCGLLFPVGRIHRHMKEMGYSARVGVGGAIYLSAVLEYLVGEVLDLAGARSKELKKQRINPNHILFAMRTDQDLELMAKDVTFPSSGIIPRDDIAALSAATVTPPTTKSKTGKAAARADIGSGSEDEEAERN